MRVDSAVMMALWQVVAVDSSVDERVAAEKGLIYRRPKSAKLVDGLQRLGEEENDGSDDGEQKGWKEVKALLRVVGG
jgi:hypothetical protein